MLEAGLGVEAAERWGTPLHLTDIDVAAAGTLKLSSAPPSVGRRGATGISPTAAPRAGSLLSLVRLLLIPPTSY